MINHREVGPCDAVRLGSSLLPLLQRSGAEAVSGGELVLRETEPLAHGSHINRSRDGVRGGPKLDLSAMMGQRLLHAANNACANAFFFLRFRFSLFHV